MCHPTEHLSVVTADLLCTDRRALSQAWFSALRLAGHEPSSHPVSGPAHWISSSSNVVCERAHESADISPSDHARAQTRLRSSGSASLDVHELPKNATLPLELRATSRLHSTSADKLARALAHASAPKTTSAQTVSLADGRVHLIVRSDGQRTRIVAVCSTALRTTVERALALAGSVRA